MENTVNRAKLWQIALFPLNNTATNLYLFSTFFISYYATGIVGLSVVLVSTLLTVMRVWDAVTDPIIGFVIDKTNGKFGKNRPFMLIGNIILLISTILMYWVTYRVSSNFRLILFIILYLIFIIGYTFQCAITKSAQTCLTNDPKQRPYFTIFDGIYNTLLFSGTQILISSVWMKQTHGFNLDFFHKFLIPYTIILSLVCTILSIIAIWSKDRTEFFGLGNIEKSNVKLKDYVDVLKNNRAIQMLIFAAATDKLCVTILNNSIVLVMLFGIICGDYSSAGTISSILIIPNIIIILIGVKQIASKLGQKKALLYSTYGCMIFNVLCFLLFVFGNPKSLNFSNLNSFTIIFIILWVFLKGVMGISSNIVIPMTADCADYETYRSGKYVPGLIGTLFSFIDKVISSLATTVVGLLISLIGFKNTQPEPNTPYSNEIFLVTMICVFGLPMIGWICNLIALKFYPLDKTKMEEVQKTIAEIKIKN